MGCLDSRLAEFIAEQTGLRDGIAVGEQERQTLVEENNELKTYVLYLEKLVDSDEQYSGRD